jgi:hypothetical protein
MPNEIDLDALNALDEKALERMQALADALTDVARNAAAFAASLQRLQAIQVVTPEPSDDPERGS